MKLKTKILIVGILVSVPILAHERFNIPESYKAQDSILPISYLENLKIQNIHEILDFNEKNKLPCLFLDVEEKSHLQFEQSFLIKISSPVMKLFMTNNPKFTKLNWDGKHNKDGGAVLLTAVANFINEQSMCKNTK